MSMFHYSRIYSNLHITFMTQFASLHGDNFLLFFNITMAQDPLKTIIYYFAFYLFFIAFGLKVLISIAEDTYDAVKMRGYYNWLDRKISVQDYIKYELNHKNDDDQPHYMFSDIFMKTI